MREHGLGTGTAGGHVGPAGDVNGDGFADVIVGAPLASPSGNAFSGQSYVVYGRGTLTTTGAGDINEFVGIAPTDTVTYTVSAVIAAAATVSTTVDAEAIVAGGLTDTVTANNTASAVTTIESPIIVTAFQINGNADLSRSQITSVDVTFDSIVAPADLTGAFSVVRIVDAQNATEIPVGTVNFALDDSTGVTVATLTFDGASTVSRGGTGELGTSLADGNYRLSVAGAQMLVSEVLVPAEFGGEIAADADNDDFFRLYGDADGNGFVNGSDLNVFGPIIFSPPNYRADLDADGDGFINGADLNVFGLSLFQNTRA